MSAFPDFPRLLEGAIVGLTNTLASMNALQYDPDTLILRLQAQVMYGGLST
jgi:hypothetical protein